ncbi:hypothetical protein [Azospirillum sp. sgz302134]
MPDCIDCAVRIHHAAAPLAEPLYDLAVQQPLGALVVTVLALYAVLTLAGRVADRVEPARAEWRPEPIPRSPQARVWRFRSAP